MNSKPKITRRKFIHTAVTGATAAGVAATLHPLQMLAATSEEPKTAAPAKMPMRPLGQTGRMVCQFSLGGQGMLELPGHTDEAVAIINRAIDLGVNYCDTAHYYGHGSSEQRVGAFKEGWHEAEWNRAENSESVTAATQESIAPEDSTAAP